MALEHQFAVISKNSKKIYISHDMEMVCVPDYFIQYIWDSLQWICSEWNGGTQKKGLSYYGFSVIKGQEINKLMCIIRQWRELLQLATDEFYLTGNFLPDENKYEKIQLAKHDLLGVLNSWEYLCKSAIEKEGKVLHNGI